MFTGLIQSIASVKSVSKTADTMLLTIDLEKGAGEIKTGDSISISGVCLTVSKISGNLAVFDVSGETLEKSTLKNLKTGSHVNIELAMKPSDRFGGHFVLGHVDGTATVKSIHKSNQFAEITFKATPELLNQMVSKGSVAVDGISLTIARMDKDGFAVAIIPETLKRTTLANAKAGEAVNIETDIIVKTVKTQLEKILPQKGLTEEKLKNLGF